MSVWRQVLCIQPPFLKNKKEICDSLVANTVAFWDILFGLMLWCSEERSVMYSCMNLWIEVFTALDPLLYSKGEMKANNSHAMKQRYNGILKGLAFLLSIWWKFRQGNFALSFDGVTNMVKIPLKSSCYFVSFNLIELAKNESQLKRAVLPWNLLKFGW